MSLQHPQPPSSFLFISLILIGPNFGHFSMNEYRKFFSIQDQHCSKLTAMVNTTIAHYQITAKLGQGGMGEVRGVSSDGHQA